VLASIGNNFFEIATLWIAVRAVGGGAGKVAAAGAGAALGFGLLGGVYADCWDRRRSMIAADVLRVSE
jgi:MFS transporter, DHA3 family, macrolide efflux protein